VADGTYTKGDDAGFHNDKNLDFRGKDITLTSKNGPDFTSVDCQFNGRGVSLLRYQGTSTVIDGFTFKNCSAPLGGAILVGGFASPLISNCIFDGNTAAEDPDSEFPIALGGAIFIVGDGTRVGNSEFLNNRVSATWGGAGGALFISADNVTVENSSFSLNESTDGGGINSNGQNFINDCVFDQNTAHSQGGAISSNGDVSINGSKFFQNTADYSGGAVYLSSDGENISVTNCLFNGNSADNGGGIFFNFGGGRITQCTFFGNIANTEGGGILTSENYNNYPFLVTVENSILWNNGTEIVASNPDAVTVTYSDIENGYLGDFKSWIC